MPLEILDKVSRLGLRTLALSEGSGGTGADHLTSCIVAEELAMGVMRDMPLQKYVHDALVFVHAGAGSDVETLKIAEAIAGYERP